MKHSKRTALTAAVFAAALSMSSAADAASALTAFSPESQQISAVLYGPPPVSGDMDDNRTLDARDLTLMKRFLLVWERDNSAVRPDWVRSYIEMDEDIGGTSAPRKLRNQLTGLQEPISFRILLNFVPYLSTEQPESDDVCQELMTRARELFNQTEILYYPYVWNENGEDVFLDNRPWMYHWGVGADTVLPISFTSLPDADNPERTTLHVSLYYRKLSPEEIGIFALSNPNHPYSRRDVILPEREPQNDDFRLDLDLCARIVKEDGTVQLFDKCEVEYDVLTGKYLVHDSMTPEQSFG